MMRRLTMFWLYAAISLSACGDEEKTAPTRDANLLNDAGASPGNAGPLADCYPAPTTYLELINACTTAEKVSKSPVLPLLLIDGGLPPLP